MPVHLIDETELLAQARAGDPEAFTALVKQYDRHIYRLALNITRNPEDAKDVLQDSLLKAYTNIERFEGRSRFYSWLVRIATNEALMKLRKRRGGKEVSLDEGREAEDGSFMPREIEDWGENPEKRYSQNELKEILATAVGGLKLPLRVVFQLRDVDGLSIEETAHALGLSAAAVKSRLLRARLQLRERLNPYFQNGADHGV